MPIVHIDLLPRSIEMKRAVVEKVTQAIVEATNVTPDKVTIVLRDMLPENYAKAGKLHCDK